MYALYSMLIFDRLLSEAPHLNKNNPEKKVRLQLRRKHYNMLVQTNRAYHSIERKALIAHIGFYHSIERKALIAHIGF